jgi:hypothetical protein
LQSEDLHVEVIVWEVRTNGARSIGRLFGLFHQPSPAALEQHRSANCDGTQHYSGFLGMLPKTCATLPPANTA